MHADGNPIIVEGGGRAGKEDAEGGGWDVDDGDLELPADLVLYSIFNFYKCN